MGARGMLKARDKTVKNGGGSVLGDIALTS